MFFFSNFKTVFDSNFKKYFLSFKYLNDKKFQVLKITETFFKITIKYTLILDSLSILIF